MSCLLLHASTFECVFLVNTNAWHAIFPTYIRIKLHTENVKTFLYLSSSQKHLRAEAFFLSFNGPQKWIHPLFFPIQQNQQTICQHAAAFMQTPIRYPASLALSSAAPSRAQKWWLCRVTVSDTFSVSNTAPSVQESAGPLAALHSETKTAGYRVFPPSAVLPLLWASWHFRRATSKVLPRSAVCCNSHLTSLVRG